MRKSTLSFRKFRARAIPGLLFLALALHPMAAPAIDVPPANGTWDPSFFSPGIDDSGRTVVADANHVYVAGRFDTAGDVVAEGIARWNRATHRWQALARRVEPAFPQLNDLALFEGQLFVAGDFTSIDGVAARFVARWDGNRWHRADDGIPGRVGRLRVTGGALYAFGPDDVQTCQFCDGARWDGRSWTRLAGQYDVLVHGEDTFEVHGSAVFRRNGTSLALTGWNPVLGAGGLRPDILASFQGSVYAGGSFQLTAPSAGRNIARFDGSKWVAVGEGLDQGVQALVAGDNYLYALTTRNDLGNSNYRIMGWDGAAWSIIAELPAFSGHIQDLSTADGSLFAVGRILRIGGSVVHNVASRSEATTQWQDVGDERGKGLDDDALAAAVVGDELYVGGRFTVAGYTEVGHVAAWNGESWRAAGDGIPGTIDLLVSGEIGTFAAGDGAPNGLVRLVDGTWSTMGIEGSVYDMIIANDALYVAGNLFIGEQIARLAVWDGESWGMLVIDVDPTALASFDDSLIIGGQFEDFTNLDIRAIARLNGNSWKPLGDGLGGPEGIDPYVSNLLAFGDALYVSGSFETVSGEPARNFASWDGSEWAPVGLGEWEVEGPTLSAAAGRLYAGPFPTAYRRDPAEWLRLGADFDGFGWIASLDGEVYAYGTFSSVGRHAAASFTRWQDCDGTGESCATTTTTTTSTTSTTIVTTTTTTTSTSTTSTTTLSTSTTTTTFVPHEFCGDANHDGDVTTTDALIALRAAVGLAGCFLLDCDIDGNLVLTAGDALGILKMSVGIPLPGACPQGGG